MVVANVIFLNLLWFASVLGAANGMVWPAGIALLVLLGFNYFYAGITQLDYKIIALSVTAGLIIDGLMMHQGWVIYAYNQPDLGWLPPLWILMLWVGFGASVRIGMQWLLNHPLFGGFLMMVGAPLSYVSAGKLGAAHMPDIGFALIFIGLSWLVYFLLVLLLMQAKEPENAMV